MRPGSYCIIAEPTEGPTAPATTGTASSVLEPNPDAYEGLGYAVTSSDSAELDGLDRYLV